MEINFKGWDLIMERLQIEEQEIIQVERQKNILYEVSKRTLDFMG